MHRESGLLSPRVYPPFCLHPDANIFQILSLDYIVALYPFLLIFMTYVLVTAYDKRYRLVVWMWRPVQRCVQRHRNTWNICTSLIEIFATFILFSSVKILGVSVQILAFTSTQDLAGNKLNDYYTIIDGTIKYFGPAHLPYALLAITISSVFVVLPFLLLAVYPCRCFHKCLNSCGLRSPVLHIFMDAFQGSYRIEPRDLRYFSAVYLLLSNANGNAISSFFSRSNAFHFRNPVFSCSCCSCCISTIQSEEPQYNRQHLGGATWNILS